MRLSHLLAAAGIIVLAAVSFYSCSSRPAVDRAPSRPLSRIAFRSAGSICPEPCDLFQFQYNYKGTFVPDVAGAYPSATAAIGSFAYPCDPQGQPPGDPRTGANCLESVGGIPATHRAIYTMAYRVHTPDGGWSAVSTYPWEAYERGFGPTPLPTEVPTATPTPLPTAPPCTDWGFPYGHPETTHPFGNCYNCAGNVVGSWDGAQCNPLTAPTPRPTPTSVTTPAPTPVPGCPAEALCLNGGRFVVTITWATPDGRSGPGHPGAMTGEAGYFWFFSPSNVEVLVKVVDGRAFNGRFWFFAAGLTNVATTIDVTDKVTGTTKRYVNPQGTPFAPVQDTGVFLAARRRRGF